MAEKPKAVIHEKWVGTCPESMVCVSDGQAKCIMILNIIAPSFGTFIASCLDQNGCNCQTYLLSILQSLLTPIIIGWIWSAKWGCAV